MSKPPLPACPIFRANATDQTNAARVADRLRAAGAAVTATTILRAALALAAAQAPRPEGSPPEAL